MMMMVTLMIKATVYDEDDGDGDDDDRKRKSKWKKVLDMFPILHMIA